MPIKCKKCKRYFKPTSKRNKVCRVCKGYWEKKGKL